MRGSLRVLHPFRKTGLKRAHIDSADNPRYRVMFRPEFNC